MPTIINASPTSGLTVSPDNSGVLELRSNGVSGASGTLVQGTSVAPTSGTTIDFNSIPSWAKRIVVMFAGLSTNGTSIIQVQLGDGTVETTGYLGGAFTTNTVNVNLSTGFPVRANAVAAADLIHGSMIISLLDKTTNTWVCQGQISRSNSADNCFVAGSKALSDTLDRIRITTVNGTDTFDAGRVNIQYEG